MKYWIVPSRDSLFHIDEAIQTQGGLVDWRKTNNFNLGDIVFIYQTKPFQCIRYKMEVVGVGVDEEHCLPQERFWLDKRAYYDGLGHTSYVRFRLLEEFLGDTLSLQHLREHGLRGNVQSARECSDDELLAFLLNPSEKADDDIYGVDYPENDESLYEGALVSVKANRYERNRKARKLCVEQKGYRCAVCGFDFKMAYGEIGKHFIHVHHLIPIYSIRKEYVLDPAKDLVPVCPNCHYMLHRKNPPYTVEEMQEIMNQHPAG